MSRTVHYDTNGKEIDTEDCINDAPTYAQEQLADLKEKEELMKAKKEKQMVTRYKQALYHAACDFARTKTNCGKCRCKDSCGCNPGTLGCRFALEDKWKRDAGIEDNQRAKDYQRADDAPTYPQEQLADIECREVVNHPSYYKTGGIEAIDVIEAWNLDFCLGNTVKYIARCGKKSDKVVEDLKKAAWYLNREIERMKKRKSMANRMEDEARMKLEPDKAYKVTKGNTDRSILTGDLVYIDGEDGSLVVPKGKGWINKNEQTQSVMDFECIRI